MFHKLTILFCIIALSACATAQSPTASTNPTWPTPCPSGETISHVVSQGQTLWRISRMYNVDLDELIRINCIPENSPIKTGQTIFIPKTANNETVTNFSSRNITDFSWPVKGMIITQFRQKSSGVLCKGIDISTNPNENILASREGRVAFVGNLPGYGETLVIDHKDGLSSVYCGSKFVLVKLGDEVEQGKVIARIGPSPRNQGDVLHFEIRKKHKPQNPLFYLN